MRNLSRLIGSSIAIATCLISIGCGHTKADRRASVACCPAPALRADLDKIAPPLVQLGAHHHPVTTTSKLAQQYFDQGLILAYAFNHAEAIRSFHEVLRLDPHCAMAYWGIAFSYGPNINQPMSAAAVPKAWEALQKARQLAPRVSQHERDYINALATRYREHAPADRAELDRAFATAMLALAKKYPADLDAATLAAEAVMDTMPWNYWGADGNLKPAAAEACKLLDFVIEKEPSHPGANHYYIHIVESGQPELGLPAAKRLGALQLQAGHLVHMPSHIYLRLGRYQESAETNRRAVAADESYAAACRPLGYYPSLYIPHNVHFLWYSLLMSGQSEQAIAAARQNVNYLRDYEHDALPLTTERQTPLVALTLARFGRWEEALREPLPGDDLLLAKGLVHYAHAMAQIGLGQFDKARDVGRQLQQLIGHSDVKALDSPALPATGILEIARRLIAAELANAEGKPEEALAQYAEVVTLEDALPYMEPPYWHHPSRQMLGPAQLRAGKSAEAEQTFRDDLNRHPENGFSLYGLLQSLRAQNKAAEAKAVEQRLRVAWQHADIDLATLPSSSRPQSHR